MRSVDVAIIGAGLSGSLAATMLGRAGYRTALIDPFETYRPDFRCEKLEDAHVEALRRTGLADEILPVGRRYKGIWIGRLGRLCEVKPVEEHGLDYSTLVNQVRKLVPNDVDFVCGKVASIAISADRQILTLSDGSTISARLAIAANGLNGGMLASCGMSRREISRCHSLSFGFDVEPVDAARFPFEAMTYFGETPADRVSYITFFPIGASMRVNLFVYRDIGDPWLRRLRDDAEATIFDCLPHLSGLSGRFRVLSPIKPRPVDLYRTENVRQPGIALVGDAYSTACPTSGTGASKGIVDVERLCGVYVPKWLKSAGMGAEKIAEFYDDPVKAAVDAHSFETSLFAKRVALSKGLGWDAYRLARFAGSRARGLTNLHHFAHAPFLMKKVKSA